MVCCQSIFSGGSEHYILLGIPLPYLFLVSLGCHFGMSVSKNLYHLYQNPRTPGQKCSDVAWAPARHGYRAGQNLFGPDQPSPKFSGVLAKIEVRLAKISNGERFCGQRQVGKRGKQRRWEQMISDVTRRIVGGYVAVQSRLCQIRVMVKRNERSNRISSVS